MQFVRNLVVCCVLSLLAVAAMNAQTSVASSATAVPQLVNFSGSAINDQGKPITGVVGITFSIYNAQEGGAPLWLETQNVQAGASGNYTVQLGAATSQGLPLDLFTSGEARWLGVQVNGGEEQPRVMLLSVPYAMKAGDASTIGGLPPSAFVLAMTPGAGSAPSTQPPSSTPPSTTPAVSGSGTADFLPLWTNSTTLGDSVLFQSGTGSTAKVGINNTAPVTTLDVKGNAMVRGYLETPAITIATASTGSNSNPMVLVASSFDSSTSKAVTQNFVWQAEPTGNDTTTPSGTLNLLFGAGTATPAETGLKLSNTGVFTFSSAQTFPGTGTITGVTTAAGSGLSGGGTSGNLNLGLINTCATNQVLQWTGSAWACSTISGGGTITGVTAGTDLTGGGTAGNVTLNVDTTKVPQLNAANTFTGNQTVNGNLSATGTVSGANFEIGSNLFGFGSYANGNAFLGFAGTSTASGSYNTGSGVAALQSLTSGIENTAVGYAALQGDTAAGSNTAIGYAALQINSGSFNTATGVQALSSNTTGVQNTANGVAALYSNTSGAYNTATGLDALKFNTTANYNTAVGDGALNSNTTTCCNTAVGYATLLNSNTGGSSSQPGAQNDAFGYEALYSNTTGTNNVAFGTQALHSNTTGSYNTAAGYGALLSNTGSAFNTAFGAQALQNENIPYFCNLPPNSCVNDAFGYQALYSNTSGSNNAAFGYSALTSNSSGENNAAFGTAALGSNTMAVSNAAFGSNALLSATTGSYNAAFGGFALENDITGNYNTAVGLGALSSNTTGSNLTCVGANCDASDSLTNATAIGAHAIVGQSNALVLGGTGEYAVNVGIGTTQPSNILTIGRGLGHPVSDSWETYSSRRWKTNIKTLPDALAKVEQLRGVTYDLKDSGKHEIGVIAEEVGKVIPEVVTYEDNGKDARGVDYSRLTAVLIEAVKQQQKQIRQQQAQIRTQQARLRTQEAQMKTQQAQSLVEHAKIAQLMSQVRAIQTSLKTGAQSGSVLSTAKAHLPVVR